jgi:hypothetical protein
VIVVECAPIVDQCMLIRVEHRADLSSRSRRSPISARRLMFRSPQTPISRILSAISSRLRGHITDTGSDPRVPNGEPQRLIAMAELRWNNPHVVDGTPRRDVDLYAVLLRIRLAQHAHRGAPTSDLAHRTPHFRPSRFRLSTAIR